MQSLWKRDKQLLLTPEIINAVNMIHDILKILDTTDLQELEKQRITTDLCVYLMCVVRSEQLAILVEWLRDNYSIDIPDRVIDEYKRYNG